MTDFTPATHPDDIKISTNTVDTELWEFQLNLYRWLFDLIVTAQEAGLTAKISREVITLEITLPNYNSLFSLVIPGITKESLQRAFIFVEEKGEMIKKHLKQQILLQTIEEKIKQALTEEELAVFKEYCENANDIYF